MDTFRQDDDEELNLTDSGLDVWDENRQNRKVLFRHLLRNELERQKPRFQEFADERSAVLREYARRLDWLSGLGIEEVVERLSANRDCGAEPAPEFEFAETFAFRFGEKWKNHEEARNWAQSVLGGRRTFAVDGSQLLLARETSFSVAAIQIGWFENPHDDALDHVKDAEIKVLTPEDLMCADEPYVQQTIVGLRRFEAEVDRVSRFLRSKTGWHVRGERMPLAFYDNTLLLSIRVSTNDFEEDFVGRLVELVRLSNETRVPLVGFVDRSLARDLLTMLDTASGSVPGSVGLDDASILSAATLDSWGDRTPFCYARRRGLGAFVDPLTGRPTVGFVYLRTTGFGPPSRIDLPAWVYEEGLLEELIDVVRAECVIGLGYPYALEAADQTAVISNRDREAFIREFGEFARSVGLDFCLSRKATSKNRRR